MKSVLGLLGLLAVLAIVNVLAHQQAAGSGALTDSKSAGVVRQSNAANLKRDVKSAVEQAMQRPIESTDGK